jgi:phage gpG-like protein
VRFSELPAYLRMLQVRAGEAAIPAADAMADAFQGRVANHTLRRFEHPAGERTNSPPGAPPAYVSGDLARSVTAVHAGTPVRATASVAPHVIYAAVQEWGGDMHSRPGGYMTFFYGNPYRARHVSVPQGPYLLPTVYEMFADGALLRAAADGFYAGMWG